MFCSCQVIFNLYFKKMQNNQRPLAPSLNEQFITIIDDRPVTTSRQVAEAFGKDHKNVLQSIDQLECSFDFNQLNFQPISYKDSYGRKQKEYAITRDGFFMLAMGFTGAKAMEFKEAFITAFNNMEQIVQRRMYGESITLTEIRKKVKNFEHRSASKETRLYPLTAARHAIGYSTGANQVEKTRYGHLLCFQQGLWYCDEDYVIMKIRMRTALNQRQLALDAPPLMPPAPEQLSIFSGVVVEMPNINSNIGVNDFIAKS